MLQCDTRLSFQWLCARSERSYIESAFSLSDLRWKGKTYSNPSSFKLCNVMRMNSVRSRWLPSWRGRKPCCCCSSCKVECPLVCPLELLLPFKCPLPSRIVEWRPTPLPLLLPSPLIPPLIAVLIRLDWFSKGDRALLFLISVSKPSLARLKGRSLSWSSWLRRVLARWRWPQCRQRGMVWRERERK